jgi:hypothetical protein
MHRYREACKQASLLAVVTAGTWMLKHRRADASDAAALRPGDEDLSDLSHVLRHPNLLHNLRLLGRLECSEERRELARVLDDVLGRASYLSSSAAALGSRKAAEHAASINAAIADARDALDRLIAAAKRSRDAEVMTACVDCVEEVVPAVDGVLESVLHNALLDVHDANPA